MEGDSSAVDGSAAEKSDQQIGARKEKVCEEGKCESSRLVTWCRSVVGLGLFITVIKNIVSGITDVMIKTTFSGINPITLVFLR